MAYELMVVGRADGDADSLFTKIEKMIKDADASSVSSQKLGKKPLAYPIKKQTDGEYFLFSFDVAGSAISTISQSLKLDQDRVLRYIVVKTKVGKTGKAVQAKVELEKPKKASKTVGESDKVKEKKTSKAKTTKTKKK